MESLKYIPLSNEFNLEVEDTKIKLYNGHKYITLDLDKKEDLYSCINILEDCVNKSIQAHFHYANENIDNNVLNLLVRDIVDKVINNSSIFLDKQDSIYRLTLNMVWQAYLKSIKEFNNHAKIEKFMFHNKFKRNSLSSNAYIVLRS